MNFGGKPDIRHYLDLRWICLISFINFMQREREWSSLPQLYLMFLNICGLTLLKYLHKKRLKTGWECPCVFVVMEDWRRHLLVRMQERWYDCSARLCPDHSGIWISDRLVPAQPTANRWSAVAVGDTSTRIYLGSVNINLIGVGHRLVPFHYRILESRFSAMLFCERGYPRNGNPSLTMQCLLLFINRNLSQMST